MMLSKIFNEADIKAFKSLIESAKRIVLTCHVRPDGDALGSTLGLAHLFAKLGKTVNVVTPDQPPRSLSFLPGFKDLIPFTKYPDYAKRLLADCDLLICCDFNKLSRIDSLQPEVEAVTAPKVLIDHHQEPDDFCQLIFSFPHMSSTCELAFRLAAALGLYADMNHDSATCICTGIITDTRNFSVNCPNPEIYLVLMKLLDKGVDKTRIVKDALETCTLESLKLQSYAISEKLELLENGRLAIVTLDAAELEKYKYEKGDTEGLVNEPLKVKGVVASFFLREDSDCIKVSARSVGEFAVSRVCSELYGGGGHLQAAGGEFHGTLEACRALLIDNLKNYSADLRRAQEKLQNTPL